MNYHTLSDFRSQSEEALDGLLSENIASLIDAGVVKLKSVAQDGMRVRTNAGAASFRPAYNIKFGSDADSQIIVGVDVVTTGSDMAQMAPMVNQVVKRCGAAPENWLVDGGIVAHDQIDAVAAQTRVIGPVPKPKTPRQNKKDTQQDKPHEPVTEGTGADVSEVTRESTYESAETEIMMNYAYLAASRGLGGPDSSVKCNRAMTRV